MYLFLLYSSTKYASFEPEEIVEEEIVQEQEEVKVKSQTKMQTREFNIKAHEEIMHRTLAAYMEVCGAQNPYRAFSALSFHRSKNLQDNMFFLKIKDVNVYNPLLRALGMRSDFNKLQEIIKFMKEDKVEFNVQTFVAIFDCLARINCKGNHLKYIRIYVKEALKQNVTFDKIMNEGIFMYDQRENVLKTMLAYDPNYRPTYTNPNLQYSNNLLNHLNDPEQLEVPQTPIDNTSSLFTSKNLESMIEKQMEFEKIGYVLVCNKSIVLLS